MHAPGPVTFKRGRMSGSGVDFSYDEDRDLMGLSDQTKVRIAGDDKNAAATDITAGSAVLARQDKFVSFERSVHIVHGTQVIDASTALGDLTEGQEHLSGLELAGGARIETPTARAGELRLMVGDVINLTYYENSEVLQSAIVTGNSSLQIAAERGSQERVLQAQNIEIGMAPDGATRDLAEWPGPCRARFAGSEGPVVEEREREHARRQRRARQGTDGRDL